MSENYRSKTSEMDYMEALFGFVEKPVRKRNTAIEVGFLSEML